MNKKEEKKVDQKEENKGQVKEVFVFPILEEFTKELLTWEEQLGSYIKSAKFKKTYDFVKKKYESEKCYPPVEKIFNAFKITQFNNLKVVIVGQDPYHQPGQAMGLCFSIPKTCKTPPSLVNIYKCIKKDPKIKNFEIPNHGDLTKWAEQGVLLLNAMLTVTQSKPMSHKASKWMDFTDFVIKSISQKKEGVIFILWGNPAQKKQNLIDSKKHFILKACHPSPLSAYKGNFFDCGHFSEINKILIENGKEAIDWKL